MNLVCIKCGRKGTAQFSSWVGVPGVLCSNVTACKKRAARKATPTEGATP